MTLSATNGHCFESPGDVCHQSVHAIRVELERHESALSAVRHALIVFAERPDFPSAEVCTGLNAISEFGRREAEVTRIIRKAARSQRQTLMGVLLRGKARGELSPDTDSASTADFLESTLAGIRMVAKAGKNRQAQRKIAAVAFGAYTATSTSPQGVS